MSLKGLNDLKRGAGTPWTPLLAAVKWGVLFALACWWRQSLFAVVSAVCVVMDVSTFYYRRHRSNRCYDCGQQMLEMSHYACPVAPDVLYARTCGRTLPEPGEVDEGQPRG